MAIKVDDKLLPEIFGGVAGPICLKTVYLQVISTHAFSCRS
jgi:hypothetical protein